MTPTKPLLALLLATTIAACSDSDKKAVKAPAKAPEVTAQEKVEVRKQITTYDDKTEVQKDGEKVKYAGIYGALNVTQDAMTAKESGATHNLPKAISDATYEGYANFETSDSQNLDSKLTLNAKFDRADAATVSGKLTDFRNISGRQALEGELNVQEAAIKAGKTEFAAPVKGKIDGKEFGAFEFDGNLAGNFFDGNEMKDGAPVEGQEGQYIFGKYEANQKAEITKNKDGEEVITRSDLGNIAGGDFAAERPLAKASK